MKANRNKNSCVLTLFFLATTDDLSNRDTALFITNTGRCVRPDKNKLTVNNVRGDIRYLVIMESGWFACQLKFKMRPSIIRAHLFICIWSIYMQKYQLCPSSTTETLLLITRFVVGRMLHSCTRCSLCDHYLQLKYADWIVRVGNTVSVQIQKYAYPILIPQINIYSYLAK